MKQNTVALTQKKVAMERNNAAQRQKRQ